MRQIKKVHPKEKSKLHPRNKNRERYDFKQLIECFPALSPFVKLNINSEDSIDFTNPEAVKALNKALLLQHYGVSNWDIPEGYLCPPIPVRAEYIHYLADFICRHNYGKIPTGPQIKCLDIGVGASCIFPIIGNKEYGWSFIGSDIDRAAIDSANQIIAQNPELQDQIEYKLQTNAKDFYYGIIRRDEHIDLSLCNPPIHAFVQETPSGKISQLNQNTEPIRNSEVQNNESYCDGGEEKFVRNLIRQSKKFADSCFWFSCLISKESNLKSVYNELKLVQAVSVETLPMGQGNKTSRIVVWTFLSPEEQKTWKNTRWKALK